MLIPEIKISTDQLKKTNKVCPISGWAANNRAIIKVIKKDNKYLKVVAHFLEFYPFKFSCLEKFPLFWFLVSMLRVFYN